EGVLPAELGVIELAPSQVSPQFAFAICRIASQGALALVASDSLAGLAFHGACSSPWVMLVRWGNPSHPTLPLKGRALIGCSVTSSPSTPARACRGTLTG